METAAEYGLLRGLTSVVFRFIYYGLGTLVLYVIIKVFERHITHRPSYAATTSLPRRLKHTYSLVLDLDETLIRSVKTRANRTIPTIPIKIDNRIAHFAVSKRPHLDTFLMEMRKYYEIIIYTASKRQYAEAILRHTLINHLVDRRLYRDDCTLNTDGEYVKDLKKVRMDTSKVILMDNSLAAGSDYPENFIPVDSWFGGDSDTALLDIMPLLRALRSVPDVRLIIKLRLQNPRKLPLPVTARSNAGPLSFREDYNLISDLSWRTLGQRLNAKVTEIMNSISISDDEEEDNVEEGLEEEEEVDTDEYSEGTNGGVGESLD